jgi:hypothetical protein
MNPAMALGLPSHLSSRIRGLMFLFYFIISICIPQQQGGDLCSLCGNSGHAQYTRQEGEPAGSCDYAIGGILRALPRARVMVHARW